MLPLSVYVTLSKSVTFCDNRRGEIKILTVRTKFDFLLEF